MPMRKVDHSASVKVNTGQPGALFLLSRMPMLPFGSSATSTQLPFSALHELLFQCRPADPSVSATVKSTPSCVTRGPIPKINRRSSEMQAAVTCGCPYQCSLRKASCAASVRCRPAAHKIILRYGTRASGAPREDEENVLMCLANCAPTCDPTSALASSRGPHR